MRRAGGNLGSAFHPTQVNHREGTHYVLWRRTRQRSNQSNDCQRRTSRRTGKPPAFDHGKILETATAVAAFRSSHPWANDRASESATPLIHPWLSPDTVVLSLPLRLQPTQAPTRHNRLC